MSVRAVRAVLCVRCFWVLTVSGHGEINTREIEKAAEDGGRECRKGTDRYDHLCLRQCAKNSVASMSGLVSQSRTGD
jgi:hypothetical protein